MHSSTRPCWTWPTCSPTVGDKIPERFLLDIDKGQIDDGDSGNTTTTDGTPATVITIETIDLEARGPNFVFGRRNWVDIRR